MISLPPSRQIALDIHINAKYPELKCYQVSSISCFEHHNGEELIGFFKEAAIPPSPPVSQEIVESPSKDSGMPFSFQGLRRD